MKKTKGQGEMNAMQVTFVPAEASINDAPLTLPVPMNGAKSDRLLEKNLAMRAGVLNRPSSSRSLIGNRNAPTGCTPGVMRFRSPVLRTLQRNLPGFPREHDNSIPPAAFGLVKRDVGHLDHRYRLGLWRKQMRGLEPPTTRTSFSVA